MQGVLGQRILTLDEQAFARAFDQSPFAVEHTLASHPLLQLEAIAELADRFPGRIERHRSDLPAVMPDGAAEIEGPPPDTVREIDDNGAWMVFWYIEQVPEYKRLLDDCLDQADSYLPRGTGRSRQREAFLFLSAPDAVTPVHFDPEHNFLLQIRGTKSMHVCPFATPEIERAELERYFDGGHRNLREMPSDDHLFQLDPGNGVYVPSFMPHWVQNGPAASISLSITFRTPASQRAERVQRINARLRQLRLSPQPPGSSPAVDRAKEAVWLTMRGPKPGLAGVKRALAARNAQSSN